MNTDFFDSYGKDFGKIVDIFGVLREITEADEDYPYVAVSKEIYELLDKPEYNETFESYGTVYTINCFEQQNINKILLLCIKLVAETIQNFQNEIVYEINDVVSSYNSKKIDGDSAMLDIEVIFTTLIRIYTVTKKALNRAMEISTDDGIETTKLNLYASKLDQQISMQKKEIQKQRLFDSI